MNDFIELPDVQGYIIEIPDTMGYSIEELKRITQFPEELCAISEMVNSSDSEIKMLGNELIKTLKDGSKPSFFCLLMVMICQIKWNIL